MMEFVNLLKGFIWYVSEDNIEKKVKFKFNVWLKGYFVVFVILLGVFVGMFFLWNDVEVCVFRLFG